MYNDVLLKILHPAGEFQFSVHTNSTLKSYPVKSYERHSLSLKEGTSHHWKYLF